MRALEGIRDRSRLFVFYEDLFRDGREQIARLASFLDLDVPGHDDPAWARLLEEIEPDLRHHSTSSLELAGAWGIPSTTRTLFLALRAAEDARRATLEAGYHDARLPDAIERIAPELWSERRQLTDARTGRTDAERRALELHGELEQIRAELTTAREGQAQLRDELARAREALNLASVRDREAQAELAAIHEQIARQQTVMDGLQSSLSWRITAPLRAGKSLVGFGRARRVRRADTATR